MDTHIVMEKKRQKKMKCNQTQSTNLNASKDKERREANGMQIKIELTTY